MLGGGPGPHLVNKRCLANTVLLLLYQNYLSKKLDVVKIGSILCKKIIPTVILPQNKIFNTERDLQWQEIKPMKCQGVTGLPWRSSG